MVLFDGPHTFTRVALYAFLVGTLFGLGAVLALVAPAHFELGLFISALGLFHLLEYVQTSVWNPQHLSLDSFLLNHSNEYHGALAFGLAEYALERLLVPSLKSLVWLKAIGVILVVSGMSLRAAALYTAKGSFNHLVQTTKARNHQLVTHGVYAWSRHPAYAGFFWYSLGTQVLLGNPVAFCGYVYALYAFFIDRIRVPFVRVPGAPGEASCVVRTEEERYLVQFFGDAYEQYRRNVPTLIPLV